MTKFPQTLFLMLTAALLLFGTASTAPADTGADKPTVVKIHASWCGTCTRLEGTWKTLQETYGDSANFVVFDVTDKAALEKSRAEAERLGLTNVLDEFKASTGTIAVIGTDGENWKSSGESPTRNATTKHSGRPAPLELGGGGGRASGGRAASALARARLRCGGGKRDDLRRV